MKHKYAEMIKAKADNMDLVVFENDQHGKDEWYEIGVGRLPVNHRYSYFLCLPQHKEAVLNCLNGGESQVASISSGWLPADCGGPVEWGWEWWYMNQNGESRIKPKKEKRWILVNHENNCTSRLYGDEQIALEALQEEFLPWKIIEIEVEV